MNEKLVAALAATFAITACSGGGSNGKAVPPRTVKTASATLSIMIPLVKHASSARVARFVSAGTQSGGIALGPFASPQNVTQSFDLSPGSPNCTTSGSARTCQVAVDLPLGSDTINLFTFDGPLIGGTRSGKLLGSATVTQTIIEGQANTVLMSLLGLPASVTIVPATQSISSTGTTVTVPLTVSVYDASGNQITGTDPFAQPVTIGLQSASLFGNSVRVIVNGGSTNQLQGPADTAALTYAGRGGSGTYTISATTNFGNTTLGTASFTVQPGVRMVQQVSGGLSNADLVQRYDNGDVWLTEPAAHKLAMRSLNGTFVEYPVASGKEPRHIIFTGNTGGGLPFVISEVPDTIGVVHTNATVTEYTLPTANAGLAGILYDPTTFTTWFAEQTAAKIGKMNGGGGFTEYPTAIMGSMPTSVAFNFLNGGIWFTDHGTNAIGLLKTDHTVVEYPLPTANAGPSKIVGQTTYDTWFTEDNAPNLGHIDNASGKIVEYPAGDVVVSLIPGASDGFTTLWLILRNGTIEYFDATSAHFTVVPNTASPGGLLPFVGTIGSNTDIWFLRNGVSVSELDELIY